MKLEDIKTEKDVRNCLEGYSEFEKAVYVETFRIPKGKVTTYGRIAKAIGKPGASRAVANTLHNNPLFPVVPCWRVVKNDGAFGGPKDAAAGRSPLSGLRRFPNTKLANTIIILRGYTA
ncbi:MAG: MGMT family protein [Thermoplasmata archaeon]|nr:MGMT family protein [Thermoplasmata archaeon]